MTKKRMIAITGILILVFAVFFGWYHNEAQKFYVKFEGEYYRIIGAIRDEDAIEEYVGEVKRITPRTLWNKDGDSNFSFEGARIGRTPEGALCIEQRIYRADDDRMESVFWHMDKIE